MITISTGGGGDVDKAAEEALAGISHPSFIIYITKLDALSALACAVRDRFPAVPSMGMQNTLASVDGSLEIPSVVLVSFDSSFQVACGVIEHLSTARCSRCARCRKMRRALAAVRRRRAWNSAAETKNAW